MGIGTPLPLKPRLDAKPWGGRALAAFGFELPADERIGEALLTAPEAVVRDGPHAGRTLGELIAADPADALGNRSLAVTRGLHAFPLLIKLINARDVLSIQVHPNDDRAPGGSLGKTEAWHVLAAEPDAVLYLGLEPGVTLNQLAALARAGQSTAHLLRRVPAVPGTTVFLPAGTVHALGAGVVIYEIQQPSAITYRVDDWGRVDARGRPRELHVEEGLAVLTPESRPAPLCPAPLRTGKIAGERLVTCPFFTLDQWSLPPGGAVEFDGAGAPWAATCLHGDLALATNDGSAVIAAGETAALLAPAGPARLTAGASGARLLRAWLDPAA